MKMTSTSINVGLNENKRVSSRVLRPPGGGHTDIFGGEPEPQRTGRRLLANAISANSHEQTKQVRSEMPEENGQTNSVNPPPELEHASAPPPPVDNVKVAVLEMEAPKMEAPKMEAPKMEAPKTEAPKMEAPKTEAPKMEVHKSEPQPDPPKRVRVPPGGFSSGLW